MTTRSDFPEILHALHAKRGCRIDGASVFIQAGGDSLLVLLSDGTFVKVQAKGGELDVTVEDVPEAVDVSEV